MTNLNGRPGIAPRPQMPGVCLEHGRNSRQTPAQNEPPRVEKVGYTVPEWCHAAGLSRSTLYELIADGKVQSVSVGRRRIITTTPAEFLASVAGQ